VAIDRGRIEALAVLGRQPSDRPGDVDAPRLDLVGVGGTTIEGFVDRAGPTSFADPTRTGCMANGSTVLDRFRRPEYTGTNRCVPCTVLNVAIAVVLSGVVAVLVPPVGIALLVASLLSIYLRGYLVPGTPTLTKRYLPASIRDRFDDHETDDQEWETLEKVADHRENAVDPETFRTENGVVAFADEHDDDGRLTDDFAAVYERKLGVYRDATDERAALGDLFDADPDAVAFEDRDYPAIDIDKRIRKWPSEAALLADLAFDAALREHASDWTDVPVEQRGTIRKGLRAFIETCPACGGDLTSSPETVESCCGIHQVIAVSCSDCGDRLQEIDPDQEDAKLTR